MNPRDLHRPPSTRHRRAVAPSAALVGARARVLARGPGTLALLAAVATAVHATAAPTRADDRATGAQAHRAYLPWSAVHAGRPEGASVPTAIPRPTDGPPSPLPPTVSPTDAPTAAPTERPSDVPTGVSTDAPTSPATPTTTPTSAPTATPPLHCQELVANGDFEAGAKRWSLIITSTRQEAARAIQNATRLGFAPHSGTYAAWLGALPDSTMDLRSDPLVKVEPARIVSATLSAAVAIVTNGPRNRQANDTFAVVMEGAQGEVRPEPLRLNDESWNDPWRWRLRQADVTTLMQRDTFSRVRVRVQSDEVDATWFYFDDVSLRACTNDG